MSVRIMAVVWSMDIPATDKMVLLALADAANDDGIAWPPVRGRKGNEHKGLLRKTSLSERAVQNAIRRLIANGHLTRDENLGHGVRYTLHPRIRCAPASGAPPQEMRPAGDAPPQQVRLTPAAGAPKPSETINTSGDKSPSVARPRSADPWASPPEGVHPDHWRDLLVNRKRKKLPNTPSAYAKLIRDVERFTDAEWPPGRIIQHAAERGWAGIYDPRGSDGNGNGKRSDLFGKPSGWAPRPGMAGSEPVSLDD